MCLLVQRANCLARCMETHKDRPCDVSGDLPARLQCRVGKWIRIKDIWHQSPLGKWVNADQTAMKTAKQQCKTSRARNNHSGYYECTITSLGPKPLQKVIVYYTCWELDPDELEAGFGPFGGFNLR